ncbi:MAG: recombinase family protein, partial [Cyanobacteriota bacterium]|nr:recombinase family protein [Cyanobacteriota bacterium]
VTRVAARGKSQDYLYLRPRNCPQQPKCKALPYQQVLERAIVRICEELPRAVAEMNQPDLGEAKAELLTQIAKQQEDLSQIPEWQARGILDEETANWRRYKLQADLARSSEQLTQFPPANLPAIAQTVALPQFWFDLSEVERRFYFREFIRHIEIVRQDNDWSLQPIFIF